MQETLYRQHAMDVLSGRVGFREECPEPSATVALASTRFETYNQMQSYYNNTAFEDIAKWARYKNKYSLYRFTRNLFNPVARVVDFYVDHVYPGVLSVDGKDLPNGVKSSIPLSHETPAELTKAIGQTWEWSNWQSRSGLMVQTGGITGHCLVEIVDDWMRGRVRYKPIWSGFVPAIELNDAGELEAYVIEYDVFDRATGETYKFGKEVQREFIAYYKNRTQTRVIPNPYGGMIPAVWVKHKDVGSDFGVPAIGNSRGKIDEVNSIASHVSDHIHKQIDSPRIMWSNGTVKNLFGPRTDGSDISQGEYDARQDTLMLKGPENGTTDTLVGNLDAATVVPIIREHLREIENDFPEITMYQKLREMHQVTGPAAAKMMGDVDNKLRRPASNYDSASAELFAKGTAIAGFRVRIGDWGSNLSKGQKQFGEFGFDSYNRGELLVKILPRPLVTDTTKDLADELMIRAQAVQAVSLDVPAEEKFRMLGKREDEIPALVAALKSEQDKKAKDALALAAASKPTPTAQKKRRK